MIAKATCLRMMMPAIIAAAVPAAIGIDRNTRSVAAPARLPAAPSVIHFLRLVFIPIGCVPGCLSAGDGSIAGERISN